MQSVNVYRNLKPQTSSEKLHAMLNAKSSSRIGRLNKNSQQVAIKQLINEDSFTKDFVRKQQKKNGKEVLSIRFKKDVQLEDLVSQRKDYQSIQIILKKMKQKNLQFKQFEKESVLALHNPRAQSKDIIEVVEEKKIEIQSSGEDDKFDSGQEDDGNGLKNEKKIINKQDKDDSEGGSTQRKSNKKKGKEGKKHQYYYEKYINHDRNLSLDYARGTSHKYFSSFKTKMMYQIPGVGKYYPRFKVIDQIKVMTIAKADLNRTRNILLVNQGLSKSTIPQISDQNRSRNQDQQLPTNSSLSNTINKQSKTTTIKELKSKSRLERNNHPLLLQNSHDDISHTITQEELTPYKDIKRGINQSITHTPAKMRDGWNNAHGMLDLNKQSERKFVFENMITINDHRFNYMQLPEIYSKNRKVGGDPYFSKSTPRQDLFSTQPYQPSYMPNFSSIHAKQPKYVNMNIKPMKEIYHNID